jgi:hypothetical protein
MLTKHRLELLRTQAAVYKDALSFELFTGVSTPLEM